MKLFKAKYRGSKRVWGYAYIRANNLEEALQKAYDLPNQEIDLDYEEDPDYDEILEVHEEDDG